MMYVTRQVTESTPKGDLGIVTGAWQQRPQDVRGGVCIREAVPSEEIAAAKRAAGRVAAMCTIGSHVHRRRLSDGLEHWRITSPELGQDISESCRPAEGPSLDTRIAWQIND
jgi:hypothetical protein